MLSVLIGGAESNSLEKRIKRPLTSCWNLLWFVHSTYILKNRNITFHKHLTEQLLDSLFSARKLEDGSAPGPSLRSLTRRQRGLCPRLGFQKFMRYTNMAPCWPSAHCPRVGICLGVATLFLLLEEAPSTHM